LIARTPISDRHFGRISVTEGFGHGAGRGVTLPN